MRCVLLLVTSCLFGCEYSDVAQAHKGRLLDKADAICTGGAGLSGPVLGTGSYFTGWCDELRVVDCSTSTQKEEMTSLTKDGVQFGVDIYVRFHADCSDGNVEAILSNMSPDKADTVSSELMYATYVRPVLGESVREVISPYVANDVNDQREVILASIRENFQGRMKGQTPAFVVIDEISLSNMDFPEEMDHANIERATQAVMKDKAIAERERVTAELETAKMREDLARQEGKTEGAKIEEIGAALQRNPMYLQYMVSLQLPEIYAKAGAAGNMVITAPSPSVVVSSKGAPLTAAPDVK